MTALAELREVSRAYGDPPVNALISVDLVIMAGEHCSIVGRSGSGKSTLLGILACLDRPSSGDVVIAGSKVTGLDDGARSALRRHSVGIVFQQFHLISHLTALENVETALLFRGMARRERLERARRMLDRVGLAARSSHRPSQLSGGEQQRVAIARAVVAEPRLILADEPTGSLDSKNGNDVLDVLEALVTPDRALVVVTHDEAIASRARRVITISDGNVTSDVTRNDLS